MIGGRERKREREGKVIGGRERETWKKERRRKGKTEKS